MKAGWYRYVNGNQARATHFADTMDDCIQYLSRHAHIKEVTVTSDTEILVLKQYDNWKESWRLKWLPEGHPHATLPDGMFQNEMIEIKPMTGPSLGLLFYLDYMSTDSLKKTLDSLNTEKDDDVV
jgi:hypothetical protein